MRHVHSASCQTLVLTTATGQLIFHHQALLTEYALCYFWKNFQKDPTSEIRGESLSVAAGHVALIAVVGPGLWKLYVVARYQQPQPTVHILFGVRCISRAARTRPLIFLLTWPAHLILPQSSPSRLSRGKPASWLVGNIESHDHAHTHTQRSGPGLCQEVNGSKWRLWRPPVQTAAQARGCTRGLLRQVSLLQRGP